MVDIFAGLNIPSANSTLTNIEKSRLPLQGALFKEISSQKPMQYRIVTLDLGIARTDSELVYNGDKIRVLSLTVGSSFAIKINETANSPLNLNNYAKIDIPFYRFFFTNTAQPGKTIVLFIGNNCDFLPALNVDATITTISAIFSNANITNPGILTTAHTMVLAANNSRRQWSIINTDTAETIYMGTTALNCFIPIYPGSSLNSNSLPMYVGDVYIYNPAVNTVNIVVYEGIV